MADYNINAVTRRVVFTGSAGLGPYSFTFEVLDQNDLAVYFNATKLTLTTDYTVTVNANGTGSVTIVTGTNVPSTPTASDQIVIVGARDIERTTDFVTAGDLRASALNEQLDAQIIMIQQIAEENKRGMRAPVYDPALVEDGGVVDMELPTKASRAGKSLAFDSDGNPIAGEDIGNWRGDWAASVAYDVRDIVKDSVNSSIYRCNTAHTSSGTAPISGNADVAKWDLVIDATAVADAEAAQAAAEAAQAAAETAETNAASSATSSANSATASASSATASAASASAAATSEANASTSESNAASSATSSSNSATASASSASASAASASAASTSESNASTSATNAASSASSASTSAATSTTQAGIATTKAGEASTSASNAATSETNAATSETNAASSATAAAASQVSAANSAASAAAAFDNFDDTYLGSFASDPTVDNDGDALVQGALYFNSTDNEMRVYDGANWIAASSAGGVSLILYEYTATAAQTTFSGADDNAATLSYTANNIQVVMNGVILDPSDYTATNGTSVVLASGAALNDVVNIYAFQSFTVADTVSASAGGTFNANVTVDGTVTADGLTVDTTGIVYSGGNVGIGTSSPLGKFMVKDGTSSPSALVVRQTSEAGAAALSLDSIFNNASNTDKEAQAQMLTLDLRLLVVAHSQNVCA
jgi:chemotaxis protein histidine kinase CheA